jgi:hypothetical protein
LSGAAVSWDALKANESKFESTKLVTGERVLRLYSRAGYILERKLDSRISLVQQKQQLLRMFEAALATLTKTSS